MEHKYKVDLDEKGYIVSFYATQEESEDVYIFDGSLLELDYLNAYKFINGVLVLDETKKAKIIAERQAEALKPTWEEIIDAQVTYTAMMTNTLIEEE